MVEVLRRKAVPSAISCSPASARLPQAETIKRCLDAELAFYAIEVFKIGLRF